MYVAVQNIYECHHLKKHKLDNDCVRGIQNGDSVISFSETSFSLAACLSLALLFLVLSGRRRSVNF